MSKLSKRLPDDNEKLQPLVGENSWSKNLIIVAGSKDNLEREFYLEHRNLQKVQPLVAQISWTHNHVEMEDLNIKAAKLAGTNKMKFEEVGV